MKLLTRIFLICSLGLPALVAQGQQSTKYTYPLKADTVTMYKDNAEFILQNSTKDTLAFLHNRGNGRTEFRKLQLEMVTSSRIALSGQDTIQLGSAPPQPQPPVILTNATCQTWNGRRTVLKTTAGDVYLKLDAPATLIDDQEIVITNMSGASGGSLTIYTNNRNIRFGDGRSSTAIKLASGSELYLIYDQPTDSYYVIGWQNFDYADDTMVYADRGACPQ